MPDDKKPRSAKISQILSAAASGRKPEAVSTRAPQHMAITLPQDVINREYNRMYQAMEHALAEAMREGKKLLVLAGERHNDRNALLQELMMTDIAHKLGIDISLKEYDEKTHDWIAQTARNNMEDGRRVCDPMLKRLDSEPSDILKKRFEQVGLVLAAKTLDPAHSRKFKPEALVIEPHNMYMAKLYENSLGINSLPVDPEYAEATKAVNEPKEMREQKWLSPARENAMVNAVADAVPLSGNKHAIGTFGLAHLPFVTSKLTERGYKVLPLYFGSPLENQLSVKENGPMEIARMHDCDHFYKPAIPYEQQFTPAEIIGMVIKASFRHEQQRPATADTLPTDEAKKLSRILDDLIQTGIFSVGDALYRVPTRPALSR